MSILASLTSGGGAHGGHTSSRAEIESIFRNRHRSVYTFSCFIERVISLCNLYY